MPAYRGFPSVDAYVSFMVDTLTRREGDVVSFGTMDKLDPVQRAESVTWQPPCTCNLPPERSDVPFCTCGAAAKASALTTDLRRKYAGQINITEALRVVR